MYLKGAKNDVSAQDYIFILSFRKKVSFKFTHSRMPDDSCSLPAAKVCPPGIPATMPCLKEGKGMIGCLAGSLSPLQMRPFHHSILASEEKLLSVSRIVDAGPFRENRSPPPCCQIMLDRIDGRAPSLGGKCWLMLQRWCAQAEAFYIDRHVTHRLVSLKPVNCAPVVTNRRA